MASAVGTSRQPSTTKNDNFVESQLDKARRRIRMLDLTTALLGLAAGALTFAVVMALLDYWFTLNDTFRVICFGGFALSVVAYVGWTIVRPLTHNINPYYAARKVEETVPNAKNSVVNWLDLHEDEKLPGAIHQAVSQRAARDVAKVDLDRAVSGRRAGWAGAVLGVVLVIFLVSLISLRASKFFSHMGRALFPFTSGEARRNTEVTLLEPEGKDITVSEEQDVTFRVLIEGRQPESVSLRTWVLEDDPEDEKRMEQDNAREWSLTLRGRDIKSPGFFYRIVAGDGSTEIHRVTVRSSPMIDLDKFVVTYKPRPYLVQKTNLVVKKQRTLDGYRGTQVMLDVATNRNLRSGRLTFSSDRTNLSQTFDAVIDPKEPQQMRFHFTLEESGKYAISFLSSDGESYSELHHRVNVKQDLAPTVELTLPAQDVTFPANDFVEIEGVARDDIGVKELTLRMRIVAGETLQPKPFRADKEIRFADGGYPLVLDYKDVLDLSSLKNEKGQPVKLKPGDVVEYWLETKDNCDYPTPNVGESKHYRVTISEPRDEKKKEEQKKQAEQRKEEHKKQQDEKLKEENKKRDEQAKEEQKKQEEENRKEEKERKEKENQRDPKNKPNEDKEQGRKPEKDPEQQKRDEKAKEDAKKLDEAAKKQEEKEREEAKQKEQQERNEGKGKGKDDKEKKGEAKPDEQKNGENKDNKGGKGGGDKKEPQQGEGKPNPDQKQEPGKDGAKEGSKEGEQPKEAGKPKQGDGMGEQKAGEQKDGQKQEGTEKQAQAKDGAGQQQQQQAQRGEGKSGDKKEGQQQAGQSKDNGGMMGDPAEAKGGEKQGDQKAQGQGKGDAPKEARAEGKPSPKDGQQGQPQAQGKGGPKEGQQAQGESKDGAKEQGQNTASGKGDRMRGDTGKGEQKPAEEANKGDVEQAAGDLKSDKATDREAARKRLDDIAKKSQDGQAREAAEEELKKERQGQGAGQAKQTPGEQKKDGQASAKGGEGQQGAGKQGENKGQGTAKGGEKKDEQKGNGSSAKGTAPGEKESRDLAKDTKDAAGDKSADPKKQKEAEEQASKAFQKALEDLKSDDPQRREQAQNMMRDLARKAKEDPNLKKGVEEKLMPGNVKKALDDLAKDMKSDDPQKREGAENALKELKKFTDENKQGLSKDEQKKLDDLERQADAGQQGTGGKARQDDIKQPLERDPSKSDKRHSNQAGDLQLDRFNDKVKKKIIEDSGLTPEQVENVRRWQKQRTAEEKEERASTEKGKPLGTDGIGQVKREGTGKDIQSNDDGKTPREYVDFYKNFTKKFTEAQQGAKDK